MSCRILRRLMALIMVLPLILPALFGSSLADAQSPPPNIILILTDDQGWTDTSVQMDPNVSGSISDFYETPNLELLAADGMRFSQAYAASPVCSPSRAAIQTGISPAKLQMTEVTVSGPGMPRFGLFFEGLPLTAPIVHDGLPLVEESIAERIKQANPNYMAAHFGKWHLNTNTNRFPLPLNKGYDAHGFAADGLIEEDQDPKHIISLTALAIQFMEENVAEDRPFFMQVSHVADHLPIEARLETIEKYQSLVPGAKHDQPEYAAMNEDLDTGIGQLLQRIEQLGISDNTYIIYTSDNGAPFGMLGPRENEPLFMGKGTI